MGKDLKGKELGKGLAQRKDGKYTYRYTLNGARIEERFDKINEAKKRKTEIEYMQQHSVLKATPKVTFEQFKEYCDKVYFYNWKDRTVTENECLYRNHIKDRFGIMYLDEITTSMIADLITSMREKDYASTTISSVRGVIKKYLNIAVEEGRIAKNPAVNRKLVISKEIRRERTALNYAEMREFEEEASKSSHYGMIVLAMETGMRAGEIGALKVQDIDFERGFLKVVRGLNMRNKRDEKPFTTPKTKTSIREVPLSDKALTVLKAKCAQSAIIISPKEEFQDLVFKSRTGLPIYSNDLLKAIRYVEKRLNQKRENRAKTLGEEFVPFPHIFNHALRYTFATNCARAGVSVKATQSMLGHSDSRITMNVYTQADNDFVKQEFSKMQTKNNVIQLRKLV